MVSFQVILFDFWRISTVGGLVGSMVACFVVAIAYEGLKVYRETVFSRNFIQNRYSKSRLL